MPKITLDGQELEFTPGETIIQAARRHDIMIPHFCWHPGLTVAGNCRICLVEVEKMPKLVIACATLATDGMVVHTQNEKVTRARNAVMEFLLINHPLDCPICDEAGECKLQDYAFKYSIGASRFDEVKNHKDKRVELGPYVMLDEERCILCSRCIRYCDEIVGETQLTFVNRGEKVKIAAFPGKQLDNPYSMNVIEICPVGALTSRDFRFKTRVWDMSNTESICTGCSNGCNMLIWVRNNTIMRLTPRENMEVNKWWMCDYGRLETYKFVNDEESRLANPMMTPAEAGILTNGHTVHENVEWDDAISRVISELKNYSADEILFIGSPYTTLEDNYALKRFANEVIGTDNICYIPHIDESFGDNFLKKSDMTPNAAGCEMLGIKPITDEMMDQIGSKFRMLYIIHDSIGTLKNGNELTKNIEVAVLHASNFFTEQNKKAAVLFPANTYAEMNGTFVNYNGRVQRIRPAVTTLETERLPDKFNVSRLDKFGAQNDKWTKGTKFNARPVWMVLSQMAKAMRSDFNYEFSEDVFDDLAEKIPEFSGLNYEKISTRGIQLKEKATA